jgi:hypothetical protein
VRPGSLPLKRERIELSPSLASWPRNAGPWLRGSYGLRERVPKLLEGIVTKREISDERR